MSDIILLDLSFPVNATNNDLPYTVVASEICVIADVANAMSVIRMQLSVWTAEAVSTRIGAVAPVCEKMKEVFNVNERQRIMKFVDASPGTPSPHSSPPPVSSQLCRSCHRQQFCPIHETTLRL